MQTLYDKLKTLIHMKQPIDFTNLSLEVQIQYLYENASFVADIRYYDQKVNLFLLEGVYYEVFISNKSVTVTDICTLDFTSSRLDFFLDQIKLKNLY